MSLWGFLTIWVAIVMNRQFLDKDIENVLEVWFSASSLVHPFLRVCFKTRHTARAFVT